MYFKIDFIREMGDKRGGTQEFRLSIFMFNFSLLY